MSLHDEVSWPLVEALTRHCLGHDVRLDELSFLAGGIVNTTLSIHTQCDRRCVFKISAHRVNPAHEREARQLEMLASLGVPVPRVIACETAQLQQPHSFILMEMVEGITLYDARTKMPTPAMERVQEELARLVCRMHQTTSNHYGKFDDPTTFTDWPGFFRSLIEPVVAEAEKLHVLPNKTRKQIQRVHDHLGQLLKHEDPPRLNHGDLWGKNILVRPDSADHWTISAIIDPELRFGDAEEELAYLDLFKTATPTFRQCYAEQFKLSDAYHRVRKPVYQLYFLLNQLQLRGPEYARPVIEAADKLAAVV